MYQGESNIELSIDNVWLLSHELSQLKFICEKNFN